ncbi:uncharacterized protein LOC132741571 [Ruditapes philippinarum]|uniref:uncharacterized protein LOC132741571 n=1 Tax=Ruditapes philippinarum TaxID=129788 RepID=UPI00295B556A|nr:uncharacterized protein LOC132741571 [Ruditapes philippinarum]
MASGGSENRINLFRLQILIIDGGLLVLRSIHDQTITAKGLTLRACLNNERKTITRLHGRNVITQDQYDILFPARGQDPTTANMDITLIICLLENLKCFGLNKKFKWNATPASTDLSVEADICRLRNFRNQICHMSTTTGIEQNEFTTLWNEIEQILIRRSTPGLKMHQTIADFKSCSLDLEEERRIKEEIKKWKDYEAGVDRLKQEMGDVKENVTKANTDLDDVKRNVMTVQEDLDDVKENVTEVKSDLDDMKEYFTEVKSDMNDVKENVTAVKGHLDDVKENVAEVKSDLDDVNESVTEVKGHLDDVKENVAEVKSDLDVVKGNITEVKGDLDDLKENVTEVKKDLDVVKENVTEVKSDLDVMQENVTEVRIGFVDVKGNVIKVQKGLEVFKRRQLTEGGSREDFPIQTEEEKYHTSKNESWDRCIERKSESDANILLEREIYPFKGELNKACHVFGRDSKLISHICNTISQHIKKQYKNVIDVLPSYKEKFESIIFLVIVKKKSTFSVFKDYEYCIRCENDVSTEGDLVAKYETKDETMSQFDNETFEKLRKCINDNAKDILERHSNINVILPSFVKSVGYETGQHNIKQVPCIALYVTVKGCIPLNETPFEKNVNGFPTDVLEGKFEPFMNGPNEYHEHLKIGLAIHANVLSTNGVLGGTLGGFIDHSTHGLCGITCAHVVYSPAELMEMKDKRQCCLRKKVYQPIGKRSSAFGEVVQAFYDIGGSCTSGMEVALISIQKRQPKSGSFPETFTDFEAGFDARNPLCFNSGAVCETSEIKRRTEVYKFGMISGITRGSFALQGAVVRKSQMQGDCHGFSFNLMNQLLVLQIGEKPFAEHGDSGALVLTEGGQDSIAIGIVAGGMNSRRVFVTPICDILRAFGCTESKMHRFIPKCTQLSPDDNGEDMEK